MKNEASGLPWVIQQIKASVVGTVMDIPINYLLIDSRKYQGQSHPLFFAIRGKVHDGHQYLEELYKKGVRHFVVDTLPEKPESDSVYLLVENVLRALQQLAAAHRKRFDYPVISITGSNGKTIIKEWAYQLLKADQAIVRSPKSYNSQVGVPLSIWGMGEQHEMAIIEAGISMPGEMEKLERMIRPTIGIMSNIGSAHQENFSKLSDKVKSKMGLFRRAEHLIYCADQKLIHKRASKLKVPNLIAWSATGQDVPTQLMEKKRQAGFTHLKVESPRGSTSFRIPFQDEASVENAMHLFCLLEHLGLSRQKIQRRMSVLQSVDMRLELKDGIHNSLIVNDGYNSDIESLRIALDFVSTHKKRRNSVVVLSDIDEQNEDKWIKAVASLLSEMAVDQFIGIGPVLSRNKELFPDNSLYFADTESFMRSIAELQWQSKIILLKGARRYAFERIQARLEQKLHQTVLRIDLNALANNLQEVREKVDSKVKLMAVVKAFSYGAGSTEVASILQYQNVDYLAVAYADEGVALRHAGIQLPIMVMNPEPESLPSMIENRLEPEIYSFRLLQQFLQALNRSNYSGERHPVHIKLDTGMHRLGFSEEEMPTLLNLLRNEKQLKVSTVFSHLAASDDPQFGKETLMQIQRFRMMSDMLVNGLEDEILRHILNSSGIDNYPEGQFDMVRLGIGLHGVFNDKRKPVASLYTHISQIKMLRKGEGVGYGFSFIAPTDMRIATIAIGYADGFSRQLSNGVGEVVINGQRAKVVGRVCMDLTMVDVSQINCQEGDEVEIFGETINVGEMAEKLNTIPYEVLTSISQRVKRIYSQE